MGILEDSYDYYLQWNMVTNVELYDHITDLEGNVNLAFEESYKKLSWDTESNVEGVSSTHNQPYEC